ncbi:PTS sugar transporter subunit IIC [uncultured Clostridium sp.]|uniref:PTS sugar transporter subunit IIC n=1 Tax=uncultured Clostridium sp. TaxID=59620 RepID=UPI00261C75C0|nr:PTS sugar transporter subunit IIC [uncultured Clostridium sp.]
MVAVRDGFIAVMPLTIVGSFFVLINNVVLDSKNGMLRSFGNFDEFKAVGLSAYYATLGFMAICLAIGVAYKLAKHYEMDALGTAFVALGAVLCLMPNSITAGDNVIGGVFSELYTSATGLFVAIIGSILAVEFLRKLQKSDKLSIKMPDTVPPSVSKSFNLLIPAIIVLTVFAIVSFLSVKYIKMDVYEIITKVIQSPIQAVFQGLPGIIVVLIVQNLLWCFGLHGAFILSPITEPTLLPAIQENMVAFQNGVDIPNIVTKPFMDAFSFAGGAGMTIGLLLAIFLVSKREDYRSVAKFSAIPGLFNINEPLMFGLPVVLNPIFMIPLVLAPVVSLVIAYLATASGFISKTVVMVPWTTPPVVSAYLATGGDIKAALLSIGLIILSVVIYIPFVIAANKIKES